MLAIEGHKVLPIPQCLNTFDSETWFDLLIFWSPISMNDINERSMLWRELFYIYFALVNSKVTVSFDFFCAVLADGCPMLLFSGSERTLSINLAGWKICFIFWKGMNSVRLMLLYGCVLSDLVLLFVN